MVSNRNLLFQGFIFRCYVSFREGNQHRPWHTENQDGSVEAARRETTKRCHWMVRRLKKMSGMSWKLKNASMFLGEPTGLIDDQTKDMYVSKYTECFLFLSHAKIIWHNALAHVSTHVQTKKQHRKRHSLHIRITTSCFFSGQNGWIFQSFGFQI